MIKLTLIKALCFAWNVRCLREARIKLWIAGGLSQTAGDETVKGSSGQ